MADYKSMYYRLFNRVSEAIEILQVAQQEGESTFTEAPDNPIIELTPPPKEDDNT